MKRILAAIIIGGVAIVGIATNAPAQDRGVNGLVLGAGGGAILGQAIGRDTEGTLIGTAVGGVLGYIIGNEMDRQTPVEHRVTVVPVWNRTVAAPHAYKPRLRHHPQCRETEILAHVNGRPQVVVTSACKVNGKWVLDRKPQGKSRRAMKITDRDHHWAGHHAQPGHGWQRHDRR